MNWFSAAIRPPKQADIFVVGDGNEFKSYPERNAPPLTELQNRALFCLAGPVAVWRNGRRLEMFCKDSVRWQPCLDE